MIDAQPTIVSLTDAAATRLRELTKDETSPEIGLRVYVYSGGCSGYRYGMMLEDQPTADDNVLSANGVRVYIDHGSVGLIQGSQIDYVDTLMGAGFTVNNPNAVAACGCGSSFRTSDDAGQARELRPLTSPDGPPGPVPRSPTAAGTTGGGCTSGRERPGMARRPTGTGLPEPPDVGNAGRAYPPAHRCRSRCSPSTPCSRPGSPCRSTCSRSATGSWSGGCLDTSSPFGIVLIRAGSEVASRGGDPELAIAGVGTFAEIREASRYSDGRWDLLAVGSGRFAIDQVHSELEPYLVADVRTIDDEIGDADAAERLVQRVIGRFVDYLHLLQPRDGEAAPPIDVQVEVDVPEPPAGEARAAGTEDPVDEVLEREAPELDPADLATTLRIPDDPSQLSFLLSGIVQVDPVRKQALLEAGSAEDRLRDLDRLLDRELVLLRRRLAPYMPERPSGVVRAN